MTSTRAINAAADVICRAMKNKNTTPANLAYALDSAGLLNSPESAAEFERLRARVAELEAQAPYREVWSSELPPGGLVCSVCGQPVESEPCPEHAPQGTADEFRIRLALTEKAEALHASSGAVTETTRTDDVRPQVAKLRALLAGQREDAHDSELHHPYRLGRDLPERGVWS